MLQLEPTQGEEGPHGDEAGVAGKHQEFAGHRHAACVHMHRCWSREYIIAGERGLMREVKPKWYVGGQLGGPALSQPRPVSMQGREGMRELEVDRVRRTFAHWDTSVWVSGSPWQKETCGAVSGTVQTAREASVPGLRWEAKGSHTRVEEEAAPCVGTQVRCH